MIVSGMYRMYQTKQLQELCDRYEVFGHHLVLSRQ